MPHCHDGALSESVDHDHAVPESVEPEAQTPTSRGGKLGERKLTVLAVLAITGLVVGGAVAGWFLPVPGAERVLPEGATVFYNAACGDCGPYMDMDLKPALASQGIPLVAARDYVNDRTYRVQLDSLSRDLGIPISLRGHLMTFIKEGHRLLVLSGYVPYAVVADALANVTAPPYQRVLIKVSDSDMSMVTQYFAWAFTGDGEWGGPYGVQEPVRTYLQTVPESGAGIRQSSEFLLPMVIGAGLVGAIVLSGDPHLMARLGSVLLFVIGGITIANALFPSIPTPFKMSGRTWGRLKPWLTRATIPAAAVSGLLVGLCTFPCSGGIYVAVVGLIASHTAYLEGVSYLLLYNLMFVLPLIIVLAVVSNKMLARRMAAWERGNQKTVRLLAGVAMLLLAVLVYAMVL